MLLLLMGWRAWGVVALRRVVVAAVVEGTVVVVGTVVVIVGMAILYGGCMGSDCGVVVARTVVVIRQFYEQWMWCGRCRNGSCCIRVVWLCSGSLWCDSCKSGSCCTTVDVVK